MKNDLIAKNEELLKMMQDIEANKADGWGAGKIGDKTGEEFDDLN